MFGPIAPGLAGQSRAEIQVVVRTELWGVLAGCDQACYNVNEIHQETHQPAPAQAQISTFGHASLELQSRPDQWNIMFQDLGLRDKRA